MAALWLRTAWVSASADPAQKSEQKTSTCNATQYTANKFLLVLLASTILVTEYTILSGKLIRLYALADSRPRKAANGERFDS